MKSSYAETNEISLVSGTEGDARYNAFIHYHIQMYYSILDVVSNCHDLISVFDCLPSDSVCMQYTNPV